MTRDYGNKRAARSRSSAPHQFLVVTLAFLLGYLSASVVDIQTISNWVGAQVAEHHEPTQKITRKETQQAQTPPKPKFEFYTLLANEKGSAQPARNTKTNNALTIAKTSASSPTTTGTSAITQAAHNTVTPKVAAMTLAKVSEGKPVSLNQSSKSAFLVQVAAFKDRKDAEHLKGSLILKGFDVHVVAISKPQGNWFRVVVGPYSNKVLAQKAQLNLAKTERLHGMITSAGG